MLVRVVSFLVILAMGACLVWVFTRLPRKRSKHDSSVGMDGGSFRDGTL